MTREMICLVCGTKFIGNEGDTFCPYHRLANRQTNSNNHILGKIIVYGILALFVLCCLSFLAAIIIVLILFG
jgi:hypothetical protein